MTHSDDDGFVLPPRLAPQHVVIVPIFRSDEEKARVLEYCRKVAAELRAQRFHDAPVRVLVDERDERGGEKVWQWVRKGVPAAPRDRAARHREGRRVRGPPRSRAEGQAERRARGVRGDDRSDAAVDPRRLARPREGVPRGAHAAHRQPRRVLRVLREPERDDEGTPTPIHGGFALTHFSGDVELEQKIKDDLSVTVRCIPLEKSEPGTCPFTGKPSAQRVVWAKAY